MILLTLSVDYYQIFLEWNSVEWSVGYLLILEVLSKFVP